jgi:hypothetical protein
MNIKFYISFEVAKLLKEKGCDIERDFLTHVYKENGHLYWSSHEDLSNELPAYTKDEVIDWLESKGIVVIVDISLSDETWIYSIYREGKHVYDSIISKEPYFSTRLEAEEAAIIRACGLL